MFDGSSDDHEVAKTIRLVISSCQPQLERPMASFVLGP